MTTKAASNSISITQSTVHFDNYLMFHVIKHVHLLSLTRLKYLEKRLNKALDKCDIKDAKDPWHYHPDREFYSFTFGAVQRYFKIAKNAQEIERLAKIKKYDEAQQLYQETERLKLEAKVYVSRG